VPFLFNTTRYGSEKWPVKAEHTAKLKKNRDEDDYADMWICTTEKKASNELKNRAGVELRAVSTWMRKDWNPKEDQEIHGGTEWTKYMNHLLLDMVMTKTSGEYLYGKT
jgi:hypothetical protein